MDRTIGNLQTMYIQSEYTKEYSLGVTNVLTNVHFYTNRQYDNSTLHKRPVQRNAAVTVHQPSNVQQSGLDTADMQAQQRNRGMVHGSQQ